MPPLILKRAPIGSNQEDYSILRPMREASILFSLRQQFPVYKNGRIPSEDFCELVRAAEKVGYRRGVPARTSRGPKAAFVEGPRDLFERGGTSSPDCVDDRQKTGRELVGGGDLDLPTAQSRRGDV